MTTTHGLGRQEQTWVIAVTNRGLFPVLLLHLEIRSTFTPIAPEHVRRGGRRRIAEASHSGPSACAAERHDIVIGAGPPLTRLDLQAAVKDALRAVHPQ